VIASLLVLVLFSFLLLIGFLDFLLKSNLCFFVLVNFSLFSLDYLSQLFYFILKLSSASLISAQLFL